eukprot:TRINITY_DN35741_c0_g1_i1.p1 TRINITY_DN35741_c0_g1~~TRINITY_DN35741_c0_g1_i1.p1  ORF type:complete len:725 (-),score=114.72 TRINITY_DN35741_c0_g1_i1:4-2085(-)
MPEGMGVGVVTRYADGESVWPAGKGQEELCVWDGRKKKGRNKISEWVPPGQDTAAGAATAFTPALPFGRPQLQDGMGSTVSQAQADREAAARAVLELERQQLSSKFMAAEEFLWRMPSVNVTWASDQFAKGRSRATWPGPRADGATRQKISEQMRVAAEGMCGGVRPWNNRSGVAPVAASTCLPQRSTAAVPAQAATAKSAAEQNMIAAQALLSQALTTRMPTSSNGTTARDASGGQAEETTKGAMRRSNAPLKGGTGSGGGCMVRCLWQNPVPLHMGSVTATACSCRWLDGYVDSTLQAGLVASGDGTGLVAIQALIQENKDKKDEDAEDDETEMLDAGSNVSGLAFLPSAAAGAHAGTGVAREASALLAVATHSSKVSLWQLVPTCCKSAGGDCADAEGGSGPCSGTELAQGLRGPPEERLGPLSAAPASGVGAAGLAAVGSNGSVFIWDVGASVDPVQTVRTVPTQMRAPPGLEGAQIADVRWISNSSLASVTLTDRRFTVWDLRKTGIAVSSQPILQGAQAQGTVSARVVFDALGVLGSAAGAVLVAACGSVVESWDMRHLAAPSMKCQAPPAGLASGGAGKGADIVASLVAIDPSGSGGNGLQRVAVGFRPSVCQGAGGGGDGCSLFVGCTASLDLQRCQGVDLIGARQSLLWAPYLGVDYGGGGAGVARRSVIIAAGEDCRLGAYTL